MDQTMLEVCRKVAERFEQLRKFTATRRVDSEAVSPSRVICLPGDEIEVVRWHCIMGPTVIRVRSHDSLVRSGERCIPFSWVMEMGAPKALASYMPFAPKTWQEILEEEEHGLVENSKS